MSPALPPPAEWPIWLRLLGSAALVALGAWLLAVMLPVLTPVLIAMGIAYLLDPLVQRLERAGVRRSFGAGLILGAAVIVILIALVLLFPLLQRQVSRIVREAPLSFEELQSRLQAWPPAQRFLVEHADQLTRLQAYVVERARENLPLLWRPVGEFVGRAFSSALGLLIGLLNLIIVPVFSFYLLADWPALRRGLMELVPERRRRYVRERYRLLDQSLGGFVRGQLLVALVLVLIYALGLSLLRVPYALLIAIVGGLANLVPYMGLVVGLVPATLAGLASGGWLKAAGAAAVFGLGQLLEGTLLGPRLVGNRVGLHPVWVLLAITAGGQFFGFLGLLLAVPVAAAIRVFVPDLVQWYKHSRYYAAAPAGPLGPTG